MSIDPYIVLGSAVVGFLVGMTGAGGGALMTPDADPPLRHQAVHRHLERPGGRRAHAPGGRRRPHDQEDGELLAGRLDGPRLGPAALLGAYVLHLLGNSTAAENNVEILLGAALLLGAAAMVLRYVLDRRSGQHRAGPHRRAGRAPAAHRRHRLLGGFVVGMTSVGSGSLMIVLLLFLYPVLGANQLVGTDLTQAVPLTLAAALGALAFGHVEFSVTDLHHHRQRAGRPRRLAHLLAGARPLHPPRHHLRDLRLGAQVRRPRHHRPGLDARRRPRGGRRVWLAYVRPRRAGARRRRRERRRPRARTALAPTGPSPPDGDPGPGDAGPDQGCGSRASAARRSPAAPPPGPRPGSGACRRACAR